MISTNEHIAGRQVSLGQIETSCERYEKASVILEQLIADLEFDLEAVKNKHLRGIKKQAAEVANLEADLYSQIETSHGLFVSPRTMTVHGVKVGLKLSPGKLEVSDEATVISMIKKYHKEDAALYIRTMEYVNKDALKTLPTEDLKKLGCKIEGAGDVVILTRVAGEVEKLINKLIGKLVEAMVGGES